MASFSRFAPINNDTVFIDTTIYEAWINLKRSSSAYNTARNFKKLRLFYGYNKKPVIAEVYKGDELLYFETMSVNNSLNVMEMNFETTPDELNIKFTGKDSPDVYAIALDNTKGIAVDNVAMRGSSGTIFKKMDYTLLTEMYKKLNVRLFLLQYGGNVIPYIDSEKECVNYGNWFKSQINTLKSACPNACFVVIGPSDMSKKENGKYITYPMLEKVRDELKKAALDAGAGYWDMYSAMGGKNSMPSWVDAKPSLASTDYTHFSSRGAKIIANMFYNALINEYDKYRKSLNNKKTNDK
jgi:lysophospholipase L1-like esterase